MTQTKCPTRGNRYHWHHAFAKFGYDDPATYLPQNILNLLNTKPPPERLFLQQTFPPPGFRQTEF